MEYIQDKRLFKAFSFARHLMRNGTRPDIANVKAAKYYKVRISDVAHHTGKLAASIKSKYCTR